MAAAELLTVLFFVMCAILQKSNKRSVKQWVHLQLFQMQLGIDAKSLKLIFPFNIAELAVFCKQEMEKQISCHFNRKKMLVLA